MAVAYSRNFDLASLIANPLYTFMVLSGGFLVKVCDMRALGLNGWLTHCLAHLIADDLVLIVS